jgi:TRAP-type mannitol/chloroaromatic compound transport system substrate-binding protein
MTSSFPKSLDTIYGGAAEFAKYVAEMTDSKSSSTAQWCG